MNESDQRMQTVRFSERCCCRLVFGDVMLVLSESLTRRFEGVYILHFLDQGSVLTQQIGQHKELRDLYKSLGILMAIESCDGLKL